MIDTHSHLFEEEFKDDLDNCITRAKEAGIEKIMLVGFSKKTNIKAQELAKKYGLQFLYRDFRVGFREGQNKARKRFQFSKR